MAGADREISLVIRAKNEATKAIDSVAEALKQLSGVQDNVGQSAAKTDGLLGELRSALTDLNREAQGLAALGTIARQLDRAADSVERLKGQASAAADTAAPLVEQYEQVAAASAELAERANQAKAAVESQAAVVAEAKAQQAALAAQLRQAEGAYREIYATIRKAVAPSEELKQSYRDQLNALMALYDQLEKAKGVYGQERETLGAVRTEYAGLAKQLTAAAEAEAKVEGAAGKALDTAGRLATGLQKARGEFGQIAEMGQRASEALGGVEVSQEALGAAAVETAANLQRVQEALAKQGSVKAAGGAGPALGPAAAAVAAFRQQVAAVQEARAAWEQARAAATELGAAIARTAEPTKQFQTDFLLSRQAAAEAEQAYMDAAAAMNRLRGVTQGSFPEFIELAQNLRYSSTAAEAASRGLTQLPVVAPKIEQNTFSLRDFVGWLLKVPGAADQAGEGVSRFHGHLGEGLGIVNRMRNEIVGLATAYLGFYGAVNQIGNVIKTVRDLESAQMRLGVVFDGDKRAAASEMQFVMDQAKRLGIEFTSLAGEYTKVAIASKEAGYSNEATRQIFLAFAEASRVAGLSTTDMESAFLGLRESIERGTLNARNFNIEIGSRVPGAMQAMAAALGVTVPKFMELQKSGNSVAASMETLVRFSENLRQRYAGELPEALKTLNAAMGTFATNVQQAQQEIGEGGFTDALKDVLTKLDDAFQSKSGEEFFEHLGAALGNLVRVVPVLVSHFGDLVTALRAIVAIKTAEMFLRAVGGANGLSAALTRAAGHVDSLGAALGALNGERVAAQFAALKAQIVAAAAAMRELNVATVMEATGAAVAEGALAALRAGMIGITAVAEAMWVAIGGFPGIVIAGLTFIATDLLGKWIGGVGQATDALEVHRQLLEKVQDAYADAAGKADELKQKLQEMSSVEIVLNTRDLTDQLQAVKDRIQAPENAYGEADPHHTVDKLKQVIDQFHQGAISAVQFKQALNSISEADPKLDVNIVRQMFDALDDSKTGAIALEKAIKENNAQLRLIRGTATDADRALLGLGDSAKHVATALDPSGIEAYTKALLDMQKAIPGLAKVAEAQSKIAELDDKLKSAQIALQGNLASSDPKVKAQAQAQIAQAQAAHDAAVQQIMGSAKLDEQMTGGQGDRLLATGRKYLGDSADRNDKTLTALMGVDPEKVAWCAAFINAVLKQNNLPTTGSNAARSFLNYGSEVSADKAEPGDIVILKGAANRPGSGHVGLFEGLNGDGSVRVLGGNQGRADGGAVTNTTFPARDVVGIRRAPAAPEVFKQQAQQEDQVEAFQKFLAKIMADSKAATDAKEVSPRDAFIQSKLKEIDDKINDSGPTAEHPNAPRLSITPRQRQQAINQFGAEYDANGQQEIKKKNAELQQQIDDKQKQDTADLTAAEIALQRQIFITNAARKDGLRTEDLLTQQGKEYAELQGKIFDMGKSQDLFGNVQGLAEQKKELITQLKQAQNDGDSDKVAELKSQLSDVVAKLQQAIPLALQFAQAIGDQKAIAAIEKIKNSVDDLKTDITSSKQINDLFVNGVVQGADKIFVSIGQAVSGTREWSATFRDVGNAFLMFASDFLKNIAEMILKAETLKLIQQTGFGQWLSGGVNGLFNSTQSAGETAAATQLTAAGASLSASGGILTTAAGLWTSVAAMIEAAAASLAAANAGGSASGLAGLVGLYHSGGEVGAAGGMTRLASPSIFTGAFRYHNGGFVGLGPNEIPAILERGERVQSRSELRQLASGARSNAGPASSGQGNTKIVNLFEASDLLSQALATEVGQKVLVNHVRSNKTAFNAALGNRS